MARLTPKELQQARQAKEAERQAEAEAAEQRDQWLIAAQERSNQLQSVADGLYEEVDKIARKWPAMPVTERTVTRVNNVLGAIRDLLKEEEDDFIDGLEDLVPAGDMPETRDVVLTLREARDALDRFDGNYRLEWQRTDREYR